MDTRRGNRRPEQPLLTKCCPPQSSGMPLDELLALYGYEASDPISERESEGSGATARLPDMTLDKVRVPLELGGGLREGRRRPGEAEVLSGPEAWMA